MFIFFPQVKKLVFTSMEFSPTFMCHMMAITSSQNTTCVWWRSASTELSTSPWETPLPVHSTSSKWYWSLACKWLTLKKTLKKWMSQIQNHIYVYLFLCIGHSMVTTPRKNFLWRFICIILKWWKGKLNPNQFNTSLRSINSGWCILISHVIKVNNVMSFL